MTPEELNRTIEFIIQSQARLAAAQEQDRVDRVAFDQRLAGLLQVQVQLLESQTRRLDEYERESRAAEKRHEETHKQMREELKEFREWQQRFEADSRKFHLESLQRLDRILDKLTDRLN